MYNLNSIPDSAVPILLCLMVEKGLSIEIISDAAGKAAHTFNLTSMILIPIVVIHLRGASFSMSELCNLIINYTFCAIELFSLIFHFSRLNVNLHALLDLVHETVELCARQLVVSRQLAITKGFNFWQTS